MRSKRANAKLLLASVCNYPLLYQNDKSTYRRCEEKNKLWGEVAKYVYGETDIIAVNRVKRQWKSLRDAFVKYHKKRQICPTIRPYIYENEMEFLLPQILNTLNKHMIIDNHFMSSHSLREEDSISISSYSGSEANDTQQEAMDDEEEIFEEISYEYEPEPHTGEYNNQKMLYEQEEKPKREEAQKEECNNNEQDKKEHHVDAFFHGISQTVKQLKPSTRARIKKLIANIVLDAEAEEVERIEHFK